MRASKTVNGVTHYYAYDGLNLIREEWGNNTLLFLYDASGSPIGMQYRNSSYAANVWDTYYYEKNLQGDIIAMYSATGAKIVSYSYDPWGRIVSMTDGNGNDVRNNASHLGNINPLRYRGYYYDRDLSLYYLASRYYDPFTCRFITADSYVSTGQGILGYNRYAYCGNNPVMYADPNGESAIAAIALVLAGVFLIDTIVETTILFTAEEYDISNYDAENDSIQIQNSSCFWNPIAQYAYSSYLHSNLTKDDGTKFFTGSASDIAGEWAAHNFGFAAFGALSLFNSVYEKEMDKARHVDIGPSLSAETRPEVRIPSQIMSFAFRIVFGDY